MEDKVRSAVDGRQHGHQSFLHGLTIGQLEFQVPAQRKGSLSRRASWPTTMEPMAGSGVPNVGDPDRSDMEDRKFPKMTGAPFLSSCVKAQPASVSA